MGNEKSKSKKISRTNLNSEVSDAVTSVELIFDDEEMAIDDAF